MSDTSVGPQVSAADLEICFRDDPEPEPRDIDGNLHDLRQALGAVLADPDADFEALAAFALDAGMWFRISGGPRWPYGYFHVGADWGNGWLYVELYDEERLESPRLALRAALEEILQQCEDAIAKENDQARTGNGA